MLQIVRETQSHSFWQFYPQSQKIDSMMSCEPMFSDRVNVDLFGNNKIKASQVVRQIKDLPLISIHVFFLPTNYVFVQSGIFQEYSQSYKTAYKMYLRA